MSDRDLPEPSRAFGQWGNRVDRRIRSLGVGATARGKTRAADCPERSFPFSWHTVIEPQDSYWVDHTMIEFDIDPGRHRVKGYMQFREDYFGNPTDMGENRHSMILTIYSRPIGSTSKTLVSATRKTPMALPIGLFADVFAHYFAPLSVSEIVESTTGLTLTLEARFEVDGATHAISPGNDAWIGPGVLIATPL